MSVSRAYIAGVGTTGVLIGFALLTLAVFSAIIAFRGWPGDAAVEGAGALSVPGDARLIDLDPVRLERAAAARGGQAGAAAAAAGGKAATREAGAGAGVGHIGGINSSGLTQVDPQAERPGSAPEGHAPALPAAPGGPQVSPGIPAGAEQAIPGAGEALGQAGAPGGEGVPEVGQGLSEAVNGAGDAVEQQSIPVPIPRP
jgi:hypothetical protein